MYRWLKAASYIAIVGCPDGLAAALTGLLMELLYRVCVALEILNPGFEYFALLAGFGTFVCLLTYRTVLYFIKIKQPDQEK